jgi:hypothetical protein
MTLRGEFRVLNQGRIEALDVREKAVPATSDGFHKSGTLGRIAERLTQLVDRFVEAVVEVHESVGGPEKSLKFLASYDLAGVLEQHSQDSKGLFLKANTQAVLAQFARSKVHFEDSKTEPSANLMVFSHGEANLDLGESTTRQFPGKLDVGIVSCKSRRE